MRKTMSAFWADESGATAIEYGLMACMVALVIIVSLTSMSATVKSMFAKVLAGFATV